MRVISWNLNNRSSTASIQYQRFSNEPIAPKINPSTHAGPAANISHIPTHSGSIPSQHCKKVYPTTIIEPAINMIPETSNHPPNPFVMASHLPTALGHLIIAFGFIKLISVPRVVMISTL